MKLSVAQDQNDQPETDLTQFPVIGEAEITFLRSYQTLVSMGVRHDIAQSLSTYAAFQEQELDQNSPLLVHVNEEIGQEPLVKGVVAA